MLSAVCGQQVNMFVAHRSVFALIKQRARGVTVNGKDFGSTEHVSQVYPLRTRPTATHSPPELIGIGCLL